MKTAILFIGNYRTFDKTHHLIKQNLIVNNNAKIFVYCECEMTTQQLHDKIISKIGAEYIGAVQAIRDSKTEEYNGILRYILANKPAVREEIFRKAMEYEMLPWTQDYLMNSGTIIQYYQLMKCMQLMINYEKENSVAFDICVRMRLDIIVSQPINLVDFFTQDMKGNKDNNAYVRSLGNQYIYDFISTSPQERSNYILYLSSIPTPVEETLIVHLNKENYMWTIGLDQVWIAKRHVFNYLYGMVYFFGDYVNVNNLFTFNAETFFTQHLQHLGIKQLIYSNPADNVFNEDYVNSHEVINDCPSFFSIIR